MFHHIISKIPVKISWAFTLVVFALFKEEYVDAYCCLVVKSKFHWRCLLPSKKTCTALNTFAEASVSLLFVKLGTMLSTGIRYRTDCAAQSWVLLTTQPRSNPHVSSPTLKWVYCFLPYYVRIVLRRQQRSIVASVRRAHSLVIVYNEVPKKINSCPFLWKPFETDSYYEHTENIFSLHASGNLAVLKP